MWEPSSPEVFASYFATFERVAFRFEAQPLYTVDYEQEEFDRFLRGGPLTPPPKIDWFSSWLNEIARITRSGKCVERVRLIDDPPTPYQRWELWGAPYNIAAGETVRLLDRQHAERLNLPRSDWWLFDEAGVVLMAFDEDGRPLESRHTGNPTVVAQYKRWSEIAKGHSVPLSNSIAA